MSRMLQRRLRVGLLLAVAASWPAGRACAGIILGPPTIKKGGDPYFLYEAPVYLDSGDTITPATGPNGFDPIDQAKDSFLTVYNLKGFSNAVGFFADSKLTEPLTDFATIAKPDGTGYTPPAQMAPPAAPGTADLTLYLVSAYPPVSNTQSSEILLGYLVFQTVLPEGEAPMKTLSYTWQDEHGQPPTLQSGSGTASVVPEPASLALLGAGLALACRFGRRRRPLADAEA